MNKPDTTTKTTHTQPTAPMPPEAEAQDAAPAATAPDPTRYGDWEINGKCIDF